MRQSEISERVETLFADIVQASESDIRRLHDLTDVPRGYRPEMRSLLLSVQETPLASHLESLAHRILSMERDEIIDLRIKLTRRATDIRVAKMQAVFDAANDAAKRISTRHEDPAEKPYSPFGKTGGRIFAKKPTKKVGALLKPLFDKGE